MANKALKFTFPEKNKELYHIGGASNPKPRKQWPIHVDDAPPKPRKSSPDSGEFHDTSPMEDILLSQRSNV